MSLIQAKQIKKFLQGARRVLTFSANGADDDATSAITTNLGSLPVQVASATQMGIVTTVGANKVEVWDSTTHEKIIAANQYEVYARITEAAGVYTLTYYYDAAGTETAYTFGSATNIDFIFKYQYDFKNLPVDFAMVLPDSYVAQDVKNFNGLYVTENCTVTATNTISNLANTPFNSNQVVLYVNGQKLRNGTDFTMSGSAITVNSGNLGYDIETTDQVDAVYFKG